MVLVVKNPPANAGEIRDTCLIPGSGRSPGGGHGHLLSIPAWRISIDRGTYQATIRRVAKSQARLKQLSMLAHMRFAL